MIRNATAADSAQLCAIYNHYVENTVISFEQTSLSEQDMALRMAQIDALGLPFLVSEDVQGSIVGYAYANTWKARVAYRYSVEITVYLAPAVRAQGLGSALYAALFKVLSTQDVHTVLACIALPNEHSIALHEKFGMTKVAHFSEVGFKFDRWLDVGYWQRNLPSAACASAGSGA